MARSLQGVLELGGGTVAKSCGEGFHDKLQKREIMLVMLRILTESGGRKILAGFTEETRLVKGRYSSIEVGESFSALGEAKHMI